MNKPKIERLIEQYRTDPSVIFQMPQFAVETPCGTALCIAGQTAINAGFRVIDVGSGDSTHTVAVDDQYSIDDDLDPWDVATDELDLTGNEARRLFMKDKWPDDLKDKPDTPALAAERLQRFLDTDGKE